MQCFSVVNLNPDLELFSWIQIQAKIENKQKNNQHCISFFLDLIVQKIQRSVPPK